MGDAHKQCEIWSRICHLNYTAICYLYDWTTHNPGCDHSDQAAPAMLSVVAGSDWRSETGEWRVESGECQK